MSQKYFTVEEANRLIPELGKILTQLQSLKREIDEKGARLRQLKAAAGGKQPEGDTTLLQPEAELEFLLIVANSLVERIGQLGAQLKDIDLGTVDFLSTMEGRDVLLCWRLGEDEICFWHGLYEGFRGRKPLSGEGEPS